MRSQNRKTIRFTCSQLNFLDEQKLMPNETLNDVVRRVIDNYQKLTESTKRVQDLQAFTSKSGLLFDLIKEVINKQDRMEQEVLAVLQIQTEIMSQMREDQSKITDHLQSFDVISEQ